MPTAGVAIVADDIEFTEFEELLDEDESAGWRREKKAENGSGTKVYSKEVPNAPINMYRVEHFFPDINASDLFDVIMDSTYRHVWDEHMLASVDLGFISPYSDVSYYAVRMPYPLSPRDFVLQRSWLDRGPNSKRIIISHSVPHKNCPPRPGYTRGTIFLSGYEITPRDSGDGSSVRYCSQMDPSGHIPSWVINKITNILISKTLVTLHKAVITYPQWKNEQEHSHFRPWIYPEQIMHCRCSLSDCRESYAESIFPGLSKAKAPAIFAANENGLFLEYLKSAAYTRHMSHPKSSPAILSEAHRDSTATIPSRDLDLIETAEKQKSDASVQKKSVKKGTTPKSKHIKRRSIDSDESMATPFEGDAFDMLLLDEDETVPVSLMDAYLFSEDLEADADDDFRVQSAPDMEEVNEERQDVERKPRRVRDHPGRSFIRSGRRWVRRGVRRLTTAVSRSPKSPSGAMVKQRVATSSGLANELVEGEQSEQGDRAGRGPSRRATVAKERAVHREPSTAVTLKVNWRSRLFEGLNLVRQRSKEGDSSGRGMRSGSSKLSLKKGKLEEPGPAIVDLKANGGRGGKSEVDTGEDSSMLTKEEVAVRKKQRSEVMLLHPVEEEDEQTQTVQSDLTPVKKASKTSRKKRSMFISGLFPNGSRAVGNEKSELTCKTGEDTRSLNEVLDAKIGEDKSASSRKVFKDNSSNPLLKNRFYIGDDDGGTGGSGL